MQSGRMELRVIVCGGRNYGSRERLWGVMAGLHQGRGPIYAVIHGNARGADTLAGMWARENDVREWPVPAEWAKHGRAAGPIRNKNMLGLDPALVVAFPGGRGTKNMVKQAQAAGIEVIEIGE